MTYVPRMQNVSAGWIGEGQLVYSTGNKLNTPLANNSALLQFRQNLAGRATPNLPVAVSKPQYNFQQIINQQTGSTGFYIQLKPQGTQNFPILSSGTHNNSGIARIVDLPARSPKPSVTVEFPKLVKKAVSEFVEPIEIISPSVKEISPSVKEVNKTSFWSSFKKGFENIFSKTKTFFKTPKGKVAIVAAVVIAAGAALWGYVADRFSDKNKPTLTSGPSKVFMPKLEHNEQQTKESKIAA